MATMSPLAQLLENVRVEKNIALEESARRLNVSAESYLQKEQEPEKVPLYVLASMMNALEFNSNEALELSLLTSRHSQD